LDGSIELRRRITSAVVSDEFVVVLTVVDHDV
jgi:hypothetical protein